MSENHTLLAFLSTLAAIVALFIISALLAYHGKSVEAIGIGGVMTGLIGVLGTFRPQQRKVEVDNAPNNPVPVEPAP